MDDLILELIIVSIGAASISLVVNFATSESASRRRGQKEKEKFFEAITSAIDTGALGSYQDLTYIFEGSTKGSISSAPQRANLSQYLREYLVDMITRAGANQAGIDLTERKTLISSLIEQNEEATPYANLPELERNIILDMMSFLDAGKPAEAMGKIRQVSTAIEAREDLLTRIRARNRRSYIMTALSLAFAAISLAVSVSVIFFR